VEVAGEAVDAEAEGGHQVLAEDLPRMDRGQRPLPGRPPDPSSRLRKNDR